jgi:hypothetical protein
MDAAEKPQRRSRAVPKPLAQTYGDLQERLRAEEAEWASKCGPVIVRRVSDTDEHAHVSD